jgi:acetyl esterase/lipase
MNRAIRNGDVPRTGVNLADVARVIIARDISYADVSPRNVLDVYRSRDARDRAPVLLFVHGGAWEHGDKKSCAPYAIRFALRGYVCVAMNYRLSQDAPYPAAVDDVRAAMAWTREHAPEYGGDGERIGLVGQSAGAHLAMLAAYGGGKEAIAPICLVEFYGPADLADPAARNMKSVRRFLDGTYRKAPGRYRDASPLSRVTPHAPPTLIIHGTVDTLVPVRQADALARALETAEVPCTIIRLEGWGHAMDRAGPVFAYCADAMERFLRRYLP